MGTPPVESIRLPGQSGTFTLLYEKSWVLPLQDAVSKMLQEHQILASISHDHLERTPQRFVGYFKEAFSGLDLDPAHVLKTGFRSGQYNEMVYVKNIEFVSMCAHHLLPFFGHVSFAYIPNKQIVGLSKIPRLVEIYAKRPQVQEKLTEEIVDTFQRVVRPKGCGVVIEAAHMCMMIRGIKKQDSTTRTTALRGIFLKNQSVKTEFLSGINGSPSTLSRK